MLRTLYVYFRIIVFFVIRESRYWKIKSLDKQGKIEEKDVLLLKTSQEIADCILNSAKIKVEVEGKENLPPEGEPYILTPNHSSFFDVPIILLAVGRLIGFVSKKENKKLPFFGRWVHLLYSVYIDRSSTRSAVKSLSEGAEFIKKGYPQVIFPEGTRTNDGRVQDFKAGSYKLAQKASAKVIPVSITGAFDLMKKGSFLMKPGTVKVKFFSALNPDLDTSEMALESQTLISNEVEKGVKRIEG